MRRGPKEWIEYQMGIRPRSFDGVVDGRIFFYNWCLSADKDDWIAQFIINNLPETKKYNFFSVFGKPLYLKRHANKNNVLFSGENLNCRFTRYRDYCLDSVGLAMGFDYLKAENYLRFPLWLMTVFEAKADFKYIKSRIDVINRQRNSGCFECALISSHDKWNTREPIYNGLKDILDISCAGKWNNNTKILWEGYGNDKLAFLKECRFTICPENEDTPYYVTEKIFDVFIAGSIPIYTGAANNPEPDIINHDAVLFWDRNDKNSNEVCRNEVRRLKEDEKYYEAFISQDKFLPEAAEIIYDKFVELKKRLLEIGE